MQSFLEDGVAFNVAAWPWDPQQSTLVFIHGSGGSKVLWDNQLRTLQAPLNLLALDLPGHGGSSGKGCNSVIEYTRAVMEFLTRAKIPGPIPAGLSLGGAVTLQLLLDYPDFFSAGVLFCTGARLKVLPLIFESIAKDYRAFVASIKKFGASAKTDPGLLQPILEDMARCPASVTSGDFLACDRFDVRERLPEIRARVLAVSGGDDVLTPPKYLEYLAEHISGARWVNIPDAGHLLPVEKAEELNRVLAAFIEEHHL